MGARPGTGSREEIRMGKYIVISSHGIGGGRFAEQGEVVELDDRTAAERLRWGFIKPHSGEEPARGKPARGKPARNGD